MKKDIQQKLVKADNIVKQILELSAIVLFAVLLLWIVYALLSNNFFNIPQQTELIINHIFKFVGIIVLCVFLLSVIARMIFSPFVKSDEEKEFEEKVDYILGNKDNLKKIVTEKSKVTSLLINLTKEQEKLICNMLKSLPSNINNSNKINTAIVSQYLTALQECGYLNDSNIYDLYAWTGSVTNKEMPSFNHFNEAYPSKTAKKVDNIKSKISSELQKLR